MPYIDTTALDQKTEEHISYAGKDMKIYDTVHYEAVRPEYTYKLVSELRDTATGEIVVDNAGKKQVITTYFKADFDLQDNQYLTYGDVIPENHEGSGMTFDVDAEIFAGRTLVVYERMYLENGYGAGSILWRSIRSFWTRTRPSMCRRCGRVRLTATHSRRRRLQTAPRRL